MQFLAQFNMGIPEFHRLRLNKDEQDSGSSEDGYLLLEESKPELKKPSLYKVMMMNDDYTPMEFVVHVLESCFYYESRASNAGHVASSQSRQS
jgi:hypothetical protein